MRGAHAVDCVGASAHFSHMSYGAFADVMRHHCFLLDQNIEDEAGNGKSGRPFLSDHSAQSAKVGVVTALWQSLYWRLQRKFKRWKRTGEATSVENSRLQHSF